MSQPTALLIDLGNSYNQNVRDHLQGIHPSQIDFLSRNNYSYHAEHRCKKFIDFELIYKNSYEAAFQKLIDFGAFKIDNGKTIAELFLDSTDKSLWYYFRFMLLYKYRKMLFEYTVFKKIEAIATNYQKVIFVHQSITLDRLITTSSNLISVYSPEKKLASKQKLKGVFKFGCLTFLRSFLGLFSLGTLIKSSKKHLFLSNAAASQKVLSLKDFSVVDGDHFSEYFQHYIERQRDFVNGAEFFPPSMAKVNEMEVKKHFILPKFKRQFNFETLLYLQMLNPLVYVNAIKEAGRIKSNFTSLKNTSTNDYLDESLLRLMQSYKRLCYFIVFRKAAVRSLFKFFRFKSIVSTNEHDTKAKSIMEVATSMGMATYGIQHGVIHYRHLHYCFSEADAAYHPFPKTTFLWGDYWKNALLSFSNYSPENIEVVGQLRTDIIPELNRQKRNTLFDHALDERFTILFPSQPLYVGEEEMRKRLALDFLKLTKTFPNVQFIIKPHPAEKDCKVFFDQLAQEVETTNYKVINDDLYKLLAFSNLVLIYNSTVGAEAVYFQKPLVVMNYSNNDFSGYLKDKVAHEVKNYDDLKNAVKQFSQSESIINKKAQKEFIRQRAYKIDGNAAERMVNYIRSKS